MASRIVVIAPNWLGDAVMALPAVAAIRARRPADTLILAGRSSTVPLFSMMPGVDEVVRLDSRGGVVGAISWAEDAAALRSARADIAVLLPNSFRSAWTAQRAGIPERWGYGADLRGRLLTRRVPRLRGRFHQAEYYLKLVEALGLAAAEGAAAVAASARVGDGRTTGGGALPVLPRLQPPAEAHERARALLARHGLPPGGLLVGLAPGAAYGKAKQWPPARYAQLAVALRDRLGAVSLILGARPDAKTGSGIISQISAQDLQTRKNERSPAEGPAAVNLTGQTDLPLLVALLTRCRAFVSNDSGAMHAAAAAGVPVTAIFGATDERGTAPLACDAAGIPSHEILTSPAWCRPCLLRECPIDHRCMTGIEACRVADAVVRQIADR
jgi:heptosyltransferase-2